MASFIQALTFKEHHVPLGRLGGHHRAPRLRFARHDLLFHCDKLSNHPELPDFGGGTADINGLAGLRSAHGLRSIIETEAPVGALFFQSVGHDV